MMTFRGRVFVFAFATLLAACLASPSFASLTLDLKNPTAAGATIVGNTVTFNATATSNVSTGVVVNAELWATVTGTDLTANEGLYKFYASFYSSNGGLIKGNLSDVFASGAGAFQAGAATTGLAADLDGDGDNDIGSTTYSDANGWFLATSAPALQSGSSFHIADLTFTGTSWYSGTVTKLFAVGRNTTTGTNNNNLWYEDGGNKFGNTLAGSEITINLTPEPATLALLSIGGLVTLVRRRARSH